MQISSFNKKYLVSFDYVTRRQISKEIKEKGELDSLYSSTITMGLDGTHCLMCLQNFADRIHQFSYKLKDIAYNTLVISKILQLIFSGVH